MRTSPPDPPADFLCGHCDEVKPIEELAGVIVECCDKRVCAGCRAKHEQEAIEIQEEAAHA